MVNRPYPPLYNSAFKNRDLPWKQNASMPSKMPSTTSIAGRSSCGGIFDFDAKQGRLSEVSRELEDPGIWSDAKRAQELGREKKQLDAVVASLTDLDRGLSDARELFIDGVLEFTMRLPA